MDAYSAGMERRIIKNTGIKKGFVKSEYERLKVFEQDIFPLFNHHSIISEADKEVISLPSIEIVPNGVDTEYFSRQEVNRATHDLVFVGNMSYPPNVDCCEYIVNRLLPLLDKSLTVMLAGINPHKRVKALASDRVTVTGYMEDIRAAYSNCKIFLAPLQIGTGLQNKILEALAMELPCVVSTLAYEAFGSSQPPIVSCDSETEYVTAINQLLNDPKKQREASSLGRQFVIDHYNWDAQTAKLIRLFHR